jgi:hypothetical protein
MRDQEAGEPPERHTKKSRIATGLTFYFIVIKELKSGNLEESQHSAVTPATGPVDEASRRSFRGRRPLQTSEDASRQSNHHNATADYCRRRPWIM